MQNICKLQSLPTTKNIKKNKNLVEIFLRVEKENLY